MEDGELRLLTFPPPNALPALQTARKAVAVHTCWEAVAAIRCGSVGRMEGRSGEGGLLPSREPHWVHSCAFHACITPHGHAFIRAGRMQASRRMPATNRCRKRLRTCATHWPTHKSEPQTSRALCTLHWALSTLHWAICVSPDSLLYCVTACLR